MATDDPDPAGPASVGAGAGDAPGDDRGLERGDDGGPVPDGEHGHGLPLGRRAFLGIVGVGLSSLVWGGAALDLLSQGTKLVPKSVRGVVPFGQGWRIYAVNPPYPRFDPAAWTLTIDGLVERPQHFTYAELLALPQARQTSDFHCVTGWSVDAVPWEGVRLDTLLDAAGPAAGATGLQFTSMEREYVDTLTMQQALMTDVMLAHTMYGQPIPREHGAPARLVIPAMYGYKGVKWVSKITVVDTIKDGYWEQRGYDRDAWIGRSNGL